MNTNKEEHNGESLAPQAPDKAFIGFEDDCIVEEHIESVGLQVILRFDNNNGASVVKLDEPESDTTPYELVVIRFHSEENNWLPFPENGITDKSGLVRNLSPEKVTVLLDSIKGL